MFIFSISLLFNFLCYHYYIITLLILSYYFFVVIIIILFLCYHYYIVYLLLFVVFILRMINRRDNQKKKKTFLHRPGTSSYREIFSKYYSINPESDCIDHAPIDLETNGECPFAVPNQPENGKYNLISVRFNKISKRFLCVCRTTHRETAYFRHQGG